MGVRAKDEDLVDGCSGEMLTPVGKLDTAAVAHCPFRKCNKVICKQKCGGPNAVVLRVRVCVVSRVWCQVYNVGCVSVGFRVYGAECRMEGRVWRAGCGV